MTTGETPYYKLVFPFGDEPMSNVDDVFRQFAQQVDTLLHNAAVAKVVAFRLQWTGTLRLPTFEDYSPAYLQALDQTSGAGTTPAYSFTAGITIPTTGIWALEGASTYLNNNPADTPVVLDNILTADGVKLRVETAFHTGASGFPVQMSTNWIGWAQAGAVVRTDNRSSHPNVDLWMNQIRLVGPLNVGSGFLGGP